MNNLVQIICGCGSAETIEECARVPRMMNAKVIVVNGIWPRLDHPTEQDVKYGDSSEWLSPDSQIDNVKEIAAKNNWHYIQMDRFAYNGDQYNTAIEYIRNNRIPCDYVWFVDGDEAIDPENTQTLLNEVESACKMGVSSVRFGVRTEILPGWKGFNYSVIGGNYGITFGEHVFAKRCGGFDGNFQFENPIPYIALSTPLLHLHHFRRNAAKRIWNNKWHGGGMEVDLRTCSDLILTDYILYLKEKYQSFYVQENDERSFYLGVDIYDRFRT